MGKSLRSRFNGNSQEVVEYARTWGTHRAMDHYGVQDYIAFKKFLEEMGCEDDLGISPLLGGADGKTWAEDLLSAVEGRLDGLKAQVSTLEDEIHKKDMMIEYLKSQQALAVEPRVERILAKCREPLAVAAR